MMSCLALNLGRAVLRVLSSNSSYTTLRRTCDISRLNGTVSRLLHAADVIEWRAAERRLDDEGITLVDARQPGRSDAPIGRQRVRSMQT